jgi:putative NIF3 family GTP cyclohydrolase 1 type 2
MLIEELETLLKRKISPQIYSDESEIYGFHYNEASNGKIAKKVMLTVDLNLKAIHYAITNKINLILSHHGLFEKPITNFNAHLIKKLTLLSKSPISIFVLNTPFIAAEGGISDTIMESLYLKLEKPFNICNQKGLEVPIGRICSHGIDRMNTESFKLESLIKRIRSNLNMEGIYYVGSLTKILQNICIIGGDYISNQLLKQAVEEGCDCYVCFEINHYDSSYAKDLGIALVEISHYECELMALRKLCNLLSLEYPKNEFILYESQNPQKIYS